METQDYTELYEAIDEVVEVEVENAREEGFFAGLLVADMLHSNTISPSVKDEDDHLDEWDGFFEGDEAIARGIDGNEAIRELEEVETAAECVETIHEKHGKGPAHLSNAGPDAKNPYVLTTVEAPPGWTRWAEDSNYLVKE